MRTNADEPICEFTNPCTTDNAIASTNTNTTGTTDTEEPPAASKNPRKVISHIFGRNKTATKLFPSQVWVHYCRKHYQRARYRSREWPFTQCDLLLDSLDRMEDWQGVRCFEVILRRREVERRGDPAHGPGALDKDKDRAVGGNGGGEGALPSPVNSDSDDNDAETRGTAGVDPTREDAENEDKDDADYGRRARSRTRTRPASSSQSQSQSPRKREAQSKRRKPTIAPAPVPSWLRHEVGTQKSFDEVRGIVQRLRDYLSRLQDEGRVDEVRFPDIEILPSFEKWVLDNAVARKKQQQKRAGSGVRG